MSENENPEKTLEKSKEVRDLTPENIDWKKDIQNKYGSDFPILVSRLNSEHEAFLFESSVKKADSELKRAMSNIQNSPYLINKSAYESDLKSAYYYCENSLNKISNIENNFGEYFTSEQKGQLNQLRKTIESLKTKINKKKTYEKRQKLLKAAQGEVVAALSNYNETGYWIRNLHPREDRGFWGTRVDASKTKNYYKKTIEIERAGASTVKFTTNCVLTEILTYYVDGSSDKENGDFIIGEYNWGRINKSSEVKIKYYKMNHPLRPDGYYISFYGKAPDGEPDCELFFKSKYDAENLKKSVDYYTELLNEK